MTLNDLTQITWRGIRALALITVSVMLLVMLVLAVNNQFATAQLRNEFATYKLTSERLHDDLNTEIDDLRQRITELEQNDSNKKQIIIQQPMTWQGMVNKEKDQDRRITALERFRLQIMSLFGNSQEAQ